jgi:hypothetical protein
MWEVVSVILRRRDSATVLAALRLLAGDAVGIPNYPRVLVVVQREMESCRAVSEYSANRAGPVCTAESGGGRRKGRGSLKLRLVSETRSGWLVPFTTGRARHLPLTVCRGREARLKAKACVLDTGKPTGYEKNIERELAEIAQVGLLRFDPIKQE